MSKLFTYYVSTGGGSDPQEVTVEEDNLSPQVIDLFTGNLINEFTKLPTASKNKFVAWIKNTQL